MEIINVFDNEGYSIDRYTISLIGNDGNSYVVATSQSPTHPWGVWSVEENDLVDSSLVRQEAEDSKHIGEEITWDELPESVRKTVEDYFDSGEES